MISFESDYIAGAHPQVLERLVETNLETLSGYGADRYCVSAKEKIRLACGLEDAQVEFLTGGTQTNEIVISTMLKDYKLSCSGYLLKTIKLQLIIKRFHCDLSAKMSAI